jgi:hypothetical protein
MYLCSDPIGSRSNSRRRHRLADCTPPTERSPAPSPARIRCRRAAGTRRRITADNLPSEVPWRPQTSIGGPKGGDGRVCGLRWAGIAGSAQFAPERREGALAMAAARQSSPSPHLRLRALDDGWKPISPWWSAVRRRLAMAHGNQPPPTAARNPRPEIESRHAGMIASTMTTRLQAVPTKSLAGANITASSMFSYNPLLMFACLPNLPSPFHCV